MKKKIARFQPSSDVTNLRFYPCIRTRDFWYSRTRPLFVFFLYVLTGFASLVFRKFLLSGFASLVFRKVCKYPFVI